MAVSGRELTQADERGLAAAGPERRASPTPTGAAISAGAADASGDRGGLSGYARYDRIASNADIAGWLLWRNFRVVTALDAGCATGFLVEVLRERGIEAEGCDVSQFAIDHASPVAVGHIRMANLFDGLRGRIGPSSWSALSRFSNTSLRTGYRPPLPSSIVSAVVISTPQSPRSAPTGRDPRDISMAKYAPSDWTCTGVGDRVPRTGARGGTWQWMPRAIWSRAT